MQSRGVTSDGAGISVGTKPVQNKRRKERFRRECLAVSYLALAALNLAHRARAAAAIFARAAALILRRRPGPRRPARF